MIEYPIKYKTDILYQVKDTLTGSHEFLSEDGRKHSPDSKIKGPNEYGIAMYKLLHSGEPLKLLKVVTFESVYEGYRFLFEHISSGTTFWIDGFGLNLTELNNKQ